MISYIVESGGRIKRARDIAESGRRFERNANVLFDEGGRRVARTDLPGGHVSTVFLWIDHGHGDGPPVLFETMIFGGDHDEYQERYCTVEEARAGHAKAVALATSTEGRSEQ